MKLSPYLIILSFCIIGCVETPKHSFYNLVNENFLKFVDTTAYKTGRLIQIPNDTLNSFNLNKICILIDTVLNNSKELNKSILASIRKENLKDFEELLLKGIEFNFNSIDISLIKKTGKYLLINSKKEKEILCSVATGKVTFYKPYMTQNEAIVILSISESFKSGYTSCWLFKKHNGVWENIKNFEIERW